MALHDIIRTCKAFVQISTKGSEIEVQQKILFIHFPAGTIKPQTPQTKRQLNDIFAKNHRRE